MRFRYLILLGLILLLAACQAQEVATVADVQPDLVVETAVVATDVSTVAVTNVPPPTATMLPTAVVAVAAEITPTVELAATDVPVLPTDEPEMVADVVTIGRTEEGVFFIGAEDAPVTVIDYSDFL